MVANRKLSATPAPEAEPWWRYGIVWFTLGLPAVVVVACLFTAVLAWRYADPVISERQPTSSLRSPALEPAERARNHAATPGR